MTSQLDITGQRILVTGASSGIGRHFATYLAGHGAHVILAARRQEKCHQAVQDIEAAGGMARAISLDVTNPDSVAQAFSEAGDIDVLINNAGINRTGTTHGIHEDDWRAVLNTNLDGVWRCSKAAIQQWLERESPGNIINIASVLGIRVANQLAAYSAAKAAVVQLTKVVALDYARHGIRCNAICPGYFETDINREFMRTDAGQKLLKRVPFRRMGELYELEGPVLLLCSPASSYMSGAAIVVDGGHLCSSL